MRPSRDEWLIRLALVVSTRGTCERAAVGAVLARDGRVISTGYVGAPSGLPHCLSVGCEMGTHGGCTRTVHAEANAIAFAARFGTGTDRSELYCTHSPCLPCAKLIINAGIVRMVYGEPYRDTSGLALLETAGLDTKQLTIPEHVNWSTGPQGTGVQGYSRMPADQAERDLNISRLVEDPSDPYPMGG